MTVNVLETLTNPGDSIVGRLVGFEASPEAPSEYGVLTLDNGITIGRSQFALSASITS